MSENPASTAGWNDPPKGYNANFYAKTPRDTRPLLTQRVGHEQTASPSVSSSAPPMPTVATTASPYTLMGQPATLPPSLVDEHPSDTSDDHELTRVEMHSALNMAFNRCDGIMNASDKTKCARRLAVMEDRDLSSATLRQLSRLVSAIERRSWTRARDLQGELMVESYAEVNTWMPAVKAIVNVLSKLV